MPETPAHIDLQFPPAFLEFTRECEAYCVPGCCGLEAYSFDPATLNAAIDRLGIEKANEACKAASEFATTHRSVKLECWSGQMEINHHWTNGEDLYRWTTDLISKVQEQMRTRTIQDA